MNAPLDNEQKKQKAMAGIRPFDKKAVQPSDTRTATNDNDTCEINPEAALAFLKRDRSQDASTPSAGPQADQLKAVLDSIPKATAPKPKTAAGSQPKTTSKPEVEAVSSDPIEATTAHYFSLEFAVEYGVPEAIVAKFIAFKVRRAEKLKSKKAFWKGKYWFFDAISRLAGRFPYFKRSSLADTLKRLKRKKLVRVGSNNKLSFDRTCWYTVSKRVSDAVESGSMIRVDLDVANTHGVCAGVLIAHMRFELLEKPAKSKKPLKDIYMPMSPTVLARLLPFDAKTIRRTLDKIDGLIVKHPARKLTYTLPELVQKEGTKPDERWTKPDDNYPKPDAKWTKPDDNTRWKPLETVGTPFKEEAQASPASDERVHHSEQASNQDNHQGHHQPSSRGMTGCAGDAKVAGDDIEKPLTFKQLTDTNKGEQSLFQFINSDPKLGIHDKPKDDLGVVARDIVMRLCWSFVDSLPSDTIRRLASIKDMDTLVVEVMALFAPHFTSALQQCDAKEFSFFKATKPVFFRASLEFVVRAIACLGKKTCYGHSIHNLAPFIYDLEQMMFGRLLRENGTRLQEWHEQNKKKYASVDEAKESDPNLSPAEKARILRNALQARISCGYIDGAGDYVERGPIIYSQDDLDMAEKLFELNRGFCVAQLLRVIDRCVATYVYGPSELDDLFHARQGYKLGYFLKFATKIAGEYEMTDMNGWVGLPEKPKVKGKGKVRKANVEPEPVAKSK